MNLKYRMFFVVLLVSLLLSIMVLAVYAGSGEDSSQETEYKTLTIVLSDYPVTLHQEAPRSGQRDLSLAEGDLGHQILSSFGELSRPYYTVSGWR